jgi:hypothetical protein
MEEGRSEGDSGKIEWKISEIICASYPEISSFFK